MAVPEKAERDGRLVEPTVKQLERAIEETIGKVEPTALELKLERAERKVLHSTPRHVLVPKDAQLWVFLRRQARRTGTHELEGSRSKHRTRAQGMTRRTLRVTVMCVLASLSACGGSHLTRKQKEQLLRSRFKSAEKHVCERSHIPCGTAVLFFTQLHGRVPTVKQMESELENLVRELRTHERALENLPSGTFTVTKEGLERAKQTLARRRAECADAKIRTVIGASVTCRK
jgi:hypothetical protein